MTNRRYVKLVTLIARTREESIARTKIKIGFGIDSRPANNRDNKQSFGRVKCIRAFPLAFSLGHSVEKSIKNSHFTEKGNERII